MVRKLKAKGFPRKLRNWRFVTLTLDRSQFSGPEEGYEVGLARLREFIRVLKDKGYSIRRDWWKLEFHQPDETGDIWPHWHYLLDYKRPIGRLDIDAAWGLGRTQIRGVTDDRFEYLFKYVAKGLDNVPDWILDRKRVRFCQGSVGFFDSPADGGPQLDHGPSPRLGIVPSDTNTENNSPVTETIGERINRWMRSAVSRTTLENGSTMYHRWELKVTWGKLLVEAARTKISHRLSDAEYEIDITKINTTEKWILQLPVNYRPALSLVEQRLATSSFVPA